MPQIPDSTARTAPQSKESSLHESITTPEMKERRLPVPVTQLSKFGFGDLDILRQITLNRKYLCMSIASPIRSRITTSHPDSPRESAAYRPDENGQPLVYNAYGFEMSYLARLEAVVMKLMIQSCCHLPR